MYAASQIRLTIPVLETSDVVIIGLNSLPSEVEELLEILAAEAAPLSTWFDFAKAYLALGREDAFKGICEEGIKDEVTEEVIRFFGVKPVHEQTQFHCGLAALHMARGKEEADRARKAECFALAAKSIQAAKLMNPDEQMVSIAQGMLHMAKNELQHARQEFTKACSQQNNGRTNIIGLLSLAALLFNQKQYKDALLLYRRALAQNPACPAEVRLGIAACQFHMGELGAAAAAFERVLALDPNNTDALMGLAVIKFSSQNVQQGMADGLQLLVRAYELDPGNLGTLILLAHYFLLKGDHSKVLTLARSALDATQVETVQATCHCLMARAHHALGQWQLASQQYSIAARLNSNLGLPHLGLAQLYVRQGAVLNASTELETALKASPGLFDALKVLGQVIGDDQAKVTKALVHMKAAVGKADDDPDVRELMAEMSATAGDHAGSLAAFKKALELHRQRRKASEQARAEVAREKRDKAIGDDGGLFGDDEAEEDEEAGLPLHVVPAMLLNNTAVLSYRAGDLDGAAALLEEAQQVASGPQAGQLAPQHMMALRYNVARLQEASGLLKQAEEGYKAILAEDPSYIDCLLRLACVARSKGATQEAWDWARKATTLEAGHSDALAIMSQLAMERRDYSQADNCIKQLLAKSKDQAAATNKDKHSTVPTIDAYAQLAYGNLLLNSAPGDRRKEIDARKAETNMYKGLECFRAVLKAEPRNAFAANGVGAVLAELGRLDDAQDVFGEVQAAVASSSGFLHIPDVYINLANVALAKQEYVTAQRLYKIAMDKLGDTKKSQVLLYLARAYYDSDDLPAAKACLLRAIHIAPTDHKLRFNAALTMQEYSVRTFRKKRPAGDVTTLPDFERARADLDCATRYFEHLETLGAPRTKLDPNKLKMHIKFCKDQAAKAVAHLEVARLEATQLAAKREEHEAMRALEAQKKALDVKMRLAMEKAMNDEREAQAKAAHDRQERLKENWRQQRSEAELAEGGAEGGGKKKGKGKKNKGGASKGGARAMAADDEEPSTEPGDDQAGEDKTEKPAEEGNLFGSDDDDEMAGLEDQDADGDAGPGSAGGRAGKRSRGALEDEEEEPAGAAAGQEEEEDEDAFLQDLDPPEGGAADGAAADGDQDDNGPSAKKPRRATLQDSDGEGGGD